ncbi:hypothetical protein GpartN1_g2805.t1 [Galdieria partita]|uniref:type I protein arginine methyltransferase n=1 Tax=Galdieria partita TaxID=83374 RepID=A0A9C7PVJ3_9RHOD|nr:hypothetical protein GpartN1_g2311.t1 [Galdieria partita]GJQ11014.1 hypothetical protein GpartN1_g2805.t1 [Galdieria partita]
MEPEPLELLLPEGSVPGVIEDCDYGLTSADYYFNSYAHFGIHEEMLKDEVRTRTYMKAILQNKHLFEGKVVLDVGCGTGVLSMFAAKAGARLVIGVECSEIIEQAKLIIKANKFEDRIVMIKEKMEDAKLPVEEVDIIISEWMGYFLLYESMLETVLFARDKYLKKGGLMFPDRAVLYLSAIEDAEYRSEKIDFWDNVYGFDMSCIKRLALTEPLIDNVGVQQIVCPTVPVLSIDVTSVKKEDLSFAVPFVLKAERNDFIHAFVAHFDVFFNHCHKPLGFSTGPQSKTTHWKQAVFYLDRELVVCTGETIYGTLASRPNRKNPRDLDIAISYHFSGSHCEAEKILRYRLH